jgi:hypothetical protein
MEGEIREKNVSTSHRVTAIGRKWLCLGNVGVTYHIYVKFISLEEIEFKILKTTKI